MAAAAKELDFERAAELRDRLIVTLSLIHICYYNK